jgi:hypothetical protein
MRMLLFLEASQPDGTTIRFGFGCDMHPKLVSVLVVIARLF